MEQRDMYERIISLMIDNSREQLMKVDAEYLRLEEARSKIEDVFLNMGLESEIFNLTRTYVDAVQEVDMRYADVSYMSGIRDTLSLLISLDLIKGDDVMIKNDNQKFELRNVVSKSENESNLRELSEAVLEIHIEEFAE